LTQGKAPRDIGTSFNSEAQPMTLTLTSPNFADGATIAQAHAFGGFGCTGGNVSPALAWSGAPEGTKSFALTCYDPDAPTGSGWWHWTVFNIPADASALNEGASHPGKSGLPTGAVEGRTDFGVAGYGGPCPPEGDKPHRYIFTLHALKEESLPLNGDTPGAQVGYYLHFATIEKGSFTASYGR
jgi:Raf kinase inhibitor-like YbhB/YbcL family protein